MGVPSKTSPSSTASIGLSFINRYARTAVKTEIKRRPLPPGVDEADLLSEVHIALLERLGPSYAEVVGKACTAEFLGDPHELVRRTFLRCVRRGINRPRWAFDKRYQRAQSRGQAAVREVPFGDGWEAVSPSVDADLALDVAMILATFDEQREAIGWGLVRGWTLREIGEDLGLSHQRVHRRACEVKDRIALHLANAG